MGVHISLQMIGLIYFGWIPSSGFAWLYGSSIPHLFSKISKIAFFKKKRFTFFWKTEQQRKSEQQPEVGKGIETERVLERYDKRWRRRGRERKQERIREYEIVFHRLNDSLESSNRLGEARLEPGATAPSRPRTWAVKSYLMLLSKLHLQEAGLEAEQLEFEQVFWFEMQAVTSTSALQCWPLFLVFWGTCTLFIVLVILIYISITLFERFLFSLVFD